MVVVACAKEVPRAKKNPQSWKIEMKTLPTATNLTSRFPIISLLAFSALQRDSVRSSEIEGWPGNILRDWRAYMSPADGFHHPLFRNPGRPCCKNRFQLSL